MFFFLSGSDALGPEASPDQSISSIFSARRDLASMAKTIIQGSGLSLEESDMLVGLYGVSELGWRVMEVDDEKYVALKELKDNLVYNASLLSRRVKRLAKAGFVETAKANKGLHFNACRVRITKKGIEKIMPIWERYCKMSCVLVEGIDSKMLRDHYAVNMEIIHRIRARRRSSTDFSLAVVPSKAEGDLN